MCCCLQPIISEEKEDQPLLELQLLQKRSCLVVDDTASIRRMLCRVLQQFDVAIAVNGVEALALMQERTFTVVFMDASMPIMDGVMCVARLREWEQQVRIIFSHGREREPSNSLTCMSFVLYTTYICAQTKSILCCVTDKRAHV
jgi:CheY-like chemotaxis protein